LALLWLLDHGLAGVDGGFCAISIPGKCPKAPPGSGSLKLRPDYQGLLTVSGVGKVLALTIALETGQVSRFATVGDFSSYCRCVGSEHRSNGKKKGSGNVKNGNKYLAWAFVEAANFAVRYEPVVKRFYQRKCAKTMPVVAIKAVAHKLARACYHVMRDRVPFDVQRAFA
jgi:transposase